MDVSIIIASSSLQSLSDKLLLVFEYLLHTRKTNEAVSFTPQDYLEEVKSIFTPVNIYDVLVWSHNIESA